MEFKWEQQRRGNVLGPAQPYSWFSSLTLVKETSLNFRRLLLLLPSFCCCSVFQLSSKCESPLCSEVRRARCLRVFRTEAKPANSNSSTLASLANYCRHAKPCPPVCHLLCVPCPRRQHEPPTSLPLTHPARAQGRWRRTKCRGRVWQQDGRRTMTPRGEL